MQIIPLSNIPNQTFTVILNDKLYRLALRTIQDLTFASVWINDQVIFYNQLCTPNNYINPYNYLSDGGKFYFRCIDNNYPNYLNFNGSQQLLFLTPAEVANA